MTLNLVAEDYPGTRDFAVPYAPAAVAAPGPATGSGAWCTATASVYDAADDENNVYVHSNQPYQDATAVAAGYSHSYRTDGSGYALIYLNGPPPGARITVTVGGATCTTSDWPTRTAPLCDTGSRSWLLPARQRRRRIMPTPAGS